MRIHLLPIRLFQSLALVGIAFFMLDGWFYADGSAKLIAAAVLFSGVLVSGAILAGSDCGGAD